MRVSRMGGEEFRVYTPTGSDLGALTAVHDDLETVLNQVLT
jgi:uncharacterized lipoprotein YajG